MIRFKYTKSNGQTSERVGIALDTPSKYYGILDFTNLPEDEQETAIHVCSQYLEELEAAKAALNEKYGFTALVKKHYKNFIPEGVSELVRYEV